ncbi:heparan sulfate glucosamine 3-O-sulfotransferase 5-like [Lineus longissimus]|uniref:heparan sulfate glucosamine 3-O-sulfotransferase 5-like n=1 Tax=Lineus longissimus TaxID=88925 RepID=UPI00315D818F
MHLSRDVGKLISVVIVALAIFLFLLFVFPRQHANKLPATFFKTLSSRKLQNGSASHRQSDFPVRILAHTWTNENVTHRNETRRRLPKCIVIGVRKGGTRALLEYINLHPSVKIAHKEPHFFDMNYSMGLKWYRSLMPYSEPNQITIEKTPKYFVWPEAPERVHRMNSSIRLILILRDPVERALSDYLQLNRKELLATDLGNEFEKLAINQVTGKVNYVWNAIQTSLYHKHLINWLKYFPRNQILILDSNVLIENPLPVLQKVESFLGLEPRITDDMFYFNATKGFYCRTEALGGCLGKFKGFPHPSLNPVVIEKLRAFFRPHNQVLYQIAGHDFKWA